MATSGYPAFLKARKLGINAYLSRSGDRSTLDPDGTFKQIEPFDNPYKREKDLLEEIQESYSEILSRNKEIKLRNPVISGLNFEKWKKSYLI